MSDRETPDGKLEGALDRALARTFRPPRLPQDFRRRLEAARSRDEKTDLSQLRLRLQNERRAHLARLEARYVRLRQRTLGIMIVAAFATGGAAALAMPWLQKHVGAAAPLIPTSLGAGLGLAIALVAWRVHARKDAP
jgi:hypothetical protein